MIVGRDVWEHRSRDTLPSIAVELFMGLGSAGRSLQSMKPSEPRENESSTGASVFECEVEPHRETVLILPIGELDMSTVDQFASTLGEITTAGFDRVVLDLRELTFIDSSGLRALLEVQSIAAPRSSL